MRDAHRAFLPAAGRDWLLPFYDPLTRLLGVGAVHAALIAQAELAPGARVLDVGCGTGTLAVRIRREHPAVEVVALDPDPKALAIARRKAARAGVSVRLEPGYGDALPFPDASFDRVLSSMMFHHLDRATKLGMLREVRRVLRPGGGFHLADFGHAEGHGTGLLTRLFHGDHHLHDNDDAAVAALLAEAGFAGVERSGAKQILIGRIAFHRGVR